MHLIHGQHGGADEPRQSRQPTFLDVFPRLPVDAALPDGTILRREARWSTTLLALVEFRCRGGRVCTDHPGELASVLGVTERTARSWLHTLLQANLLRRATDGLIVHKLLADHRAATLSELGLRRLRIHAAIASDCTMGWGTKFVVSKRNQLDARQVSLTAEAIAHDVGLHPQVVRRILRRLDQGGVAEPNRRMQ